MADVALEVRYLKNGREESVALNYGEGRLVPERRPPREDPIHWLTRLTFLTPGGRSSFRVDLSPSDSSLVIFEPGRKEDLILRARVYSPFTNELDVLVKQERRARRASTRFVVVLRFGPGSDHTFDWRDDWEGESHWAFFKRATAVFTGESNKELRLKCRVDTAGPLGPKAKGQEILFTSESVELPPRSEAPLGTGTWRRPGIFRPLHSALVLTARIPPGWLHQDWPELGAWAGPVTKKLHIRQVPLTIDLGLEESDGSIPELARGSRLPNWLLVVENVPHPRVVRLWNDPIRGYLEALRLDRRVSFLPQLRTQDNEPAWTSLFLVTPRSGKPRDASTSRAEMGPDGASWQARWLSTQPARRQPPQTAPLELELPRVLTHGGGRPAFAFGVRLPVDLQEEDLWPGRAWPFRGLRMVNRGIRAGLKGPIALIDRGGKRDRLIRMGAVDVLLGTEYRGQEPAGLEPGELFSRAASPVSAGSRLEEVALRAHLPLQRILPGGQDRPAHSPSAAQPAPIVVHQPFGDFPPSGELLLEVTEKRSRDGFPSLRLEIWPGEVPGAGPGVDNDGGRAKVVVIDSNPFLVAMVEVPPFHRWVSASDPIIAEWTERGGWQLRLSPREDQKPFRLVLPAPAVGETMERYRSLGEGRRADLRLAPPAEIEYSTQQQVTSFSEAPWNLRRLMDTLESDGLGLVTGSIQFELFYGLTCKWEAEEPILGLRLAELFSRVGRIPGPMQPWLSWSSQQTVDRYRGVYEAAQKRWERMRRQVAARLAVLEPWRPGLEALEKKDELSCRIRQPSVRPDRTRRRGLRPDVDADLAHPLETLDFDPCEKVSGRDDPDPSCGEADPVPNCADGSVAELCGGVTWGFESRNIYDAVLRLGDQEADDPENEELWPLSHDAVVRDLAFSSLGAWGEQRVEFDGGSSKIETATAMGRGYSYRLERIGRIGNWWNRARHVIVYERTVVPSRQFACDQELHAGRPVLRKVREFVEILQPVRTYPDDPRSPKDAQAGGSRAAGPILACAFGSDNGSVPRFAVRSSWGRDVHLGGEDVHARLGWVVPLWRRDAAPKDLYPEPVVRLKVAAHVDGERREAWVRIDNPEDLVFYSDTSAEPERTSAEPERGPDSWPPVGSGIDYADHPRPTVPQGKNFGARDPVSTAAPEPAVPPGLGSCTFRLAASTVEVDLMAHRGQQPIGARLQTVTLMRANPKRAEDAGTPPPQAARLRSGFAELLAQLPTAGKVPTELAAELQKRGDTELRRIEIAAREVAEDLKAHQEVAAKASDQLKELETDGPYDQLKAELRKAARDEIAATRVAWTREVHQTVASLRREVTTALDVRPFIRTMRDRVVRLQGRPGASLRLARSYFDAARAEVHRAIAAFEVSLSEIEQRANGYADGSAAALEERQRWLDGHLLRANSAITTVEARVRSVAAGQPQRRKSSPLPDFSTAFVAEFLAGLGTAKGQIDALRTTATLETNEVKEVLEAQKNAVAEVLQTLEDSQERKRVEGEIDRVEDGIATLLAELEASVDDLISGPGRPGPELIAILDQAEAWDAALVGAISTFLASLTATLEAWIDRLFLWLEEKAMEIADNLVDAWAPWLKQVAADVNTAVEKVESAVESERKQLEGWLKQEASRARSELEAARDRLLGPIEREIDYRLGDLRRLEAEGQDLYARAEPTLNLVRAFGEPPRVSGLDLDRPEVAFFYDAADEVGITPVIARAQQVSQVGEALKPLGIVLPTEKIGERLLPEELASFRLADILPSVGGLDLSHLFEGVTMPPGSGKGFDVRHGYDRESRRAWLRADMNFQVPETTTIFAVGPLALRVEGPRFEGQVRVEGGLRGEPSRMVRGQIEGHWQMVVGGAEIIRFDETHLIFDEDGTLDFQVDPTKVNLHPTIRFIDEFLSAISDPESGFTLSFTGTAVRAQLLLPVPDLGGGTFSITGLTFLVGLDLLFAGKFELAFRVGLASQQRPFALTVFILGGGGYLEAKARYLPELGKVVDQEVHLAVTASAGLSISLGPISGGVFVYFGITGDYVAGGAGLDLGILIAVRGHVSVLGIASASIGLSLRGRYAGTGGSRRLIGEGRVEIKIKICWCFTLEVDESVDYELAGPAPTATLPHGPSPVARIARVGRMQVGPEAAEDFRRSEIRRFADDYVALQV